MTTQTIAIDPGFGNIKIAWFDAGGNIQTRVIPSVVGIGQVSDLRMLGLDRQRKRRSRPFTVSFGNISYLVGENVHRHAPPIEDLDHRRLSEGTVSQGLYYAALGQAINGHPTGVNLALGFPVELLKDKERAKAALQAVRSWLVGCHQFELDGRPVELEVEQIKVAAQPVGAYMDWGSDDNGQWIQGVEALKKPVAICDIGFNTIDLFSIEGGEIVDRSTQGDDLGMHRVAETVRSYIAENHRIDLSLHEADDLIRQYLKTGQVILSCADGDVDLSPVIGQALGQALIDIRTFIKKYWQTGRQFYKLIFAGGGTESWRAPLLRDNPVAYLPADPVTSNVRGLLKRARRIFKG